MLPLWVQYIQAFAVPVIAAVGVLVAISNHRLAKRNRRDALFDRRFELYRKIVGFLEERRSHPSGVAVRLNDEPIRERFADEAELLFGEDISTHIRDNAKRESSDSVSAGRVTKDFFAPFKQYLRLDNQ